MIKYIWNLYKIIVGKPEGKRPLGRPRRRLVDKVKMDLREISLSGVDWIDLAQDRAVEGFCEHGNEPSDSIKFWEVLEYLHNWRLLKRGSAP
jgi:hypothetical protein